jgi:glycogen synthase
VKLLLYTHAFAPSIGGVETIVRVLAAGLVRREVEVTVATPTPAGGTDDSQFGFPVARLSGLWQLFRLIRAADVVHLAGPAFAPLALGLLLRKPVVVEHHGYQSICPNGVLFYEPDRTSCPGHFMARNYRACLRCNASAGRLKSLKMLLLNFPRRWLCRIAAANVAPTNWVSVQIALPRTETIYHGLHATPPRPTPSLAPRTPSFTFLGRFVSVKGARVVLEAAARLKAQALAFRLNLVGDGPERSNLEQLARKLNIEDGVDFLGYLRPGPPEHALMASDAILVPSLAGDTFGLVVLENMLRGKLVIVSDIGALAEVIGDAGLVCPAGDVEAWAACMRGVIENPALCLELGRKARERALRFFNDSKMVEKHLELYRSFHGEQVSSRGNERSAPEGAS